MECDHKWNDGTSAIEPVLFYEEDKNGNLRLQVDFLECELCGRRFIVSV
jgi:hypothetical protein